MKRILFIILMCLPLLLGQTIIRESLVAIAWDKVVATSEDVISYEVLIASLGNYSSAEIIMQTDFLEAEVTILAEGNWVIGVRTVRTIVASGEILYSDINWSDINGLATPAPFFLRYYEVPVAPSNLRIQ